MGPCGPNNNQDNKRGGGRNRHREGIYKGLDDLLNNWK
jgi:hypothetical protein